MGNVSAKQCHVSDPTLKLFLHVLRVCQHNLQISGGGDWWVLALLAALGQTLHSDICIGESSLLWGPVPTATLCISSPFKLAFKQDESFFLLLVYPKASPVEKCQDDTLLLYYLQEGNVLAVAAGTGVQSNSESRSSQKLAAYGLFSASKPKAVPAAAGSKYFSGEHLLLENPYYLNENQCIGTCRGTSVEEW